MVFACINIENSNTTLKLKNVDKIKLKAFYKNCNIQKY